MTLLGLRRPPWWWLAALLFLIMALWLARARAQSIVDGETVEEFGTVTVRRKARLVPRSAAPTDPLRGDIYYDDTDNNLYVRDNAGWTDLTAVGGGGGNAFGTIRGIAASGGEADVVADAAADTLTFGPTTNQIEVTYRSSADVISIDVLEANILLQNVGGVATDSQIANVLTLQAGSSIDTSNVMPQDVGILTQDESLTGNWVNTTNPWADNEVANTLTLSAGYTIDGSSGMPTDVGVLSQAETITGNWVNTDNPWSNDEVSNVLSLDAGYIINGSSGMPTDVGILTEDESLTGNWVNTTNPWADNEVANTLTLSAGYTIDGASGMPADVGILSQAETITGNWVNTDFPWADNEVSDAITIGASAGMPSDVAVLTQDELVTGTYQFNRPMRYLGTEPRRTLVFTAQGAVVAGASPDLVKTDGTNVDFYNLGFDPNQSDDAYWTFAVPDSIIGTSADAFVYWRATDDGARVASWSVNSVGRADDEVLDAAGGAYARVQDTQTASNDLLIAPVATFTHDWVSSDFGIFHVRREGGSGGDTLTSDAMLVMVRVEYTVANESD